jgi:hypothetical protein
MTAETLEMMFVYLGCANIPTQEAMDGAIPLESIASSAAPDRFVTCFKPGDIEKMTPDWLTKAVWFAGENLGLSTLANVHWSRISKTISCHRDVLKAGGALISMKPLTSDSDGYATLAYSEIDRYGKFLKFPVERRYAKQYVVTKKFNPRWTLIFRDGYMDCIASENNDLYVSKRLSFLAPLLCGVAQSMGCFWLVKTRFDSMCPSLTLLTDPTGVKEFWKLRNVPEGRSRRSALLHWVEQHWRQTRKDPDVEAFVRKHMRGEKTVRQGFLHAEITPSVRDSVEAEEAAEERRLMRARKEDRRRRSIIAARFNAAKKKALVRPWTGSARSGR